MYSKPGIEDPAVVLVGTDCYSHIEVEININISIPVRHHGISGLGLVVKLLRILQIILYSNIN